MTDDCPNVIRVFPDRNKWTPDDEWAFVGDLPLRPWHVEYFDSIPIGELWWACDQPEDFGWLEKAKALFSHLPLRKMRCYTMIGYGDETLAEAEKRIEHVFELGFVPFSQLYQPPDANVPTKIYGADWKAVNRKWSRPAAQFAKEEEISAPLLEACL